MLNLNNKSIKDFTTCARLYDFRYNDKLYESVGRREMLALRYENTLKKVAAFFFYKKQGGSIPSYSALLNRWEKMWFPKEMTAYDIAVEQQESAYGNLASYTADATAALAGFHDRFAADAGQPFMIDDAFTVPLTKTIKLEGIFDLVLRYRKDNIFNVVQWHTGARKPIVANYISEFAILKHAFEYKMEGRSPNIVYGVYDITSAKPGFFEITTSQEDLDAVQYWAEQIEQEAIFPNRRGMTSYCKSCPYYDNVCEKWRFPQNEARTTS